MDVHLHLAVTGLGTGARWENDAMLGKAGRGGREMGHLLACPAARFGWLHTYASRELPTSCYPGS